MARTTTKASPPSHWPIDITWPLTVMVKSPLAGQHKIEGSRKRHQCGRTRRDRPLEREASGGRGTGPHLEDMEKDALGWFMFRDEI